MKGSMSVGGGEPPNTAVESDAFRSALTAPMLGTPHCER